MKGKLHPAEDVPGKKGKDSAAAKYASATPSDGFSSQEEKPYAEVSVQLTCLPSILTPSSAMDGDASFVAI
jgi:hypothetical protein